MRVPPPVPSAWSLTVGAGAGGGATRYLVIDLAFVVQGEDEEELPEHILGTVRLSRIDLSQAKQLPDHS